MKVKKEIIIKAIREEVYVTRGFLYIAREIKPCAENYYFRAWVLFRRDIQGGLERIGFYNDEGERL